MAYIPPRYAPRDDWREVLRSGGGVGNIVSNWQTDMLMYFKFTEDDHESPQEAWTRLDMTHDHATKALSTEPPRPNNSAGLIPPAIAALVFARALAKSGDPLPVVSLNLDHSIRVSMDATEASFKRPRYRPQRDWQQRLLSMDPDVGSWQADLAKYWRLRIEGKKTEEQAWEEVGMTPQNARMALIEDEGDPDAGLIPCLPEHGVDTVARRVLARSAANKIDEDDIYPGLILEAA
jgi:hypothetical protein